MPITNQFALFCICIGASFLFGLVYEIFSFTSDIFTFLKKGKRAVVFALDIVFFLIFAVWCVGIFYFFEFPNFRLYYLLGFFVGGIIYLKSLHIIVAFLKKMCYNKLIKVIKKRKARKKIG